MQGSDHLNRQSWLGGNLVTLATRGTLRAKTTYIDGTFAYPADPNKGQPGDLIFYGSPHSHVAMWLGNGQVLSFAPGNNRPKVESVNFRSDIDAVYAYYDFLL